MMCTFLRTVAFCAGLFPCVLFAATIETKISPPMAEIGCTIRLNGEIESGDLSRLRAVLSVPPSYDDETWPRVNSPSMTYGFPFATHRLCLNSPGGSFSEAMRIAENLSDFGDEYNKKGIPTGIARGDSCFSACSLVFMSGRYSWLETVEDYWHANHLLHPSAQLGFHAPILPFGGGTYTDEQVTKIWGVSMSSIALLSERINSGDTYINDRLFADLVRTVPPGVTRVMTVNDAVKWGVTVLHPDYGLMDFDERSVARNVCDNVASLVSGQISFDPAAGSGNHSRAYLAERFEYSDGPVWIVEDGYEDVDTGQRFTCVFDPKNVEDCSFSPVTTPFGLDSGPSVRFFFWKDGVVEAKNGILQPFGEITIPTCLVVFPPEMLIARLFEDSMDRENTSGSFSLLTDCDIQGGDLTTDGIRPVSLFECGERCVEAKNCAGFSYVLAERWCWPKSKVSNYCSSDDTRPGAISGFRRRGAQTRR